MHSELLSHTLLHSLYKKEVDMRSGPLYTLLWRILTWCSRKQVTQGPTHSRVAESGSRQAVQSRPDHPDSMVSLCRGLSVDMQQVVPTSDRPVCYEVQHFVSPVPDPFAWAACLGRILILMLSHQ